MPQPSYPTFLDWQFQLLLTSLLPYTFITTISFYDMFRIILHFVLCSLLVKGRVSAPWRRIAFTVEVYSRILFGSPNFLSLQMLFSLFNPRFALVILSKQASSFVNKNLTNADNDNNMDMSTKMEMSQVNKPANSRLMGFDSVRTSLQQFPLVISSGVARGAPPPTIRIEAVFFSQP